MLKKTLINLASLLVQWALSTGSAAWRAASAKTAALDTTSRADLLTQGVAANLGQLAQLSTYTDAELRHMLAVAELEQRQLASGELAKRIVQSVVLYRRLRVFLGIPSKS